MHSSNMVFVPGPMHPDLFGGETPIMIPVKAPNVYEVKVGFTRTVTRTESDSMEICLAAYTKDEAKKAALEQAEEDASSDEDDFEIESIEKLNREPTRDELDGMSARQRVAEGRD